MKTIRHIELYTMPDLEKVTRQLAFLHVGDLFANNSYLIEKKEHEHLAFINNLDKLGAFVNPEDKTIFTYLQMLRLAPVSDKIPANLRAFEENLQKQTNSRSRTVAGQYQRDVLSNKPVSYINYVTIPEFFAHYNKNDRIKNVARNVTKAIYKNYLSLTSAEIMSSDYMIVTDEKNAVRKANESVDEFIDKHTAIIGQIDGTIKRYDEFDNMFNLMLTKQEIEQKKALDEKNSVFGKLKQQHELKEGFEAYLSKDFGQMPGHEHVEKVLRTNLQNVNADIEEYKALYLGLDKKARHIGQVYDAIKVDPHQHFVDKMPEEFNV